MDITLLLAAFGAVTTAVFVEHRYHDRGLRPRVYGWAIGPALLLVVPTLLVMGAVLFEPSAIIAVVLFGGNGHQFGWYGPMLLLSLWSFLYLVVSAVSWVVYRLVVPGK
jgi:hypothetical protein